MAKRSTDLQNVDFHLELLRHLPQHRKTTAKELQQFLSEQGINKDLRTVQRALKKLTERGDIECDNRAMPYGYRQCQHQQRRHLITPEVATFLKLAGDKLGKVLPNNIMNAVAPMLEDAAYVLQHSQRALLQRHFLSKINYLPSDEFSYVEQYKIIANALAQQRQVTITNWQNISLNVTPIAMFKQYFSAYTKNHSLFPVLYSQIKQARMLTLSAEIPPENHRASFDVECSKSHATHFDALTSILPSEPIINKQREYSMVYKDLDIIEHQSAVILCVQGEQSRAFVQSLNLVQTEDFHIHYGALSELNVNAGSCDGIIYLADSISLQDRAVIAEKVKSADSHLIFSLTPDCLSVQQQNPDSELCVISQHSQHQLRQLLSFIHCSISQAGLIGIGVDSFQGVLNDRQQIAFSHATAKGENRALVATGQAMLSLQSQGVLLADAEFMVVAIHAGMDLSLDEFAQIGEMLQCQIKDEQSLIIGSVLDFTAEETLEIRLLVGTPQAKSREI